MSTNDDIWDEFDDFCKSIGLLPGMTFETSLLGRPSFFLTDGKYVPVIDDNLQRRAKAHGYWI